MTSTYEFDNDPSLYHERANKLRAWAAEVSDEKIKTDLRRLADEYDRHAENEIKRRTKIMVAVRPRPGASRPIDGGAEA